MFIIYWPTPSFDHSPTQSLAESLITVINEMATSKTWTRTLKNLYSEKPGPWKTWNKYRIKKYAWL